MHRKDADNQAVIWLKCHRSQKVPFNDNVKKKQPNINFAYLFEIKECIDTDFLQWDLTKWFYVHKLLSFIFQFLCP